MLQSQMALDHMNTVFGFGLSEHPPTQHTQPPSAAQSCAAAHSGEAKPSRESTLPRNSCLSQQLEGYVTAKGSAQSILKVQVHKGLSLQQGILKVQVHKALSLHLQKQKCLKGHRNRGLCAASS